MRLPVENFAKDIAPADAGGRLDAPAFHRNKDALCAAMAEIFVGRSGDVLEIGSGTGQHGVVLAGAMPDLNFWPTDPVAEHLVSIEAWRCSADLPNLRAPARLDVTTPGWATSAGEVADGSLVGMFAVNVIHIAPWPVAEAIVAGAARFLASDGHLIFYGPYTRNGVHTAPSNAEFDAALKARNPVYGVRDLSDLEACAAASGITLDREIEMPANNLLLVFNRT